MGFQSPGALEAASSQAALGDVGQGNRGSLGESELQTGCHEVPDALTGRGLK